MVKQRLVMNTKKNRRNLSTAAANYFEKEKSIQPERYFTYTTKGGYLAVFYMCLNVLYIN